MNARGSLALPEPAAVSQRELLGLLLGCAARRSATFSQAAFALRAAGCGPDVRPLTRELLTDLGIRGWIEMRLRLANGDEVEIERRLWEFELTAERNWVEDYAQVSCYALTAKGRDRLLRVADR